MRNGMYSKEGRKKVENILRIAFKKQNVYDAIDYALKELNILHNIKKYREANDTMVRDIVIGRIDQFFKTGKKITHVDLQKYNYLTNPILMSTLYNRNK